VLQNLIGNAIKFTEVGRVTVTVARGSTVGADDAPVEADVLIHVADTGIGISEAFQERLFESFTQESTGHGRSYEGSGLGLSIAKQLTEKMGGEISVESEKGEGSRFTLRFPLADGSEASAGPQRGEARRAEVTVDGTRKRVFVVGDHAEMRTLIQRLLEATYDIAAVGNAKAAVALARETDADARPFAAVLVDVDGGSETSYLEVVRRLRALPAYERVPIAAVTADALPDDRERLLAEGYSACLEKPFLPEELKELVSRLVAEETEG
jgi:CheY-like chemotaxis protein